MRQDAHRFAQRRRSGQVEEGAVELDAQRSAHPLRRFLFRLAIAQKNERRATRDQGASHGGESLGTPLLPVACGGARLHADERTMQVGQSRLMLRQKRRAAPPFGIGRPERGARVIGRLTGQFRHDRAQNVQTALGFGAIGVVRNRVGQKPSAPSVSKPARTRPPHRLAAAAARSERSATRHKSGRSCRRNAPIR